MEGVKVGVLAWASHSALYFWEFLQWGVSERGGGDREKQKVKPCEQDEWEAPSQP